MKTRPLKENEILLPSGRIVELKYLSPSEKDDMLRMIQSDPRSKNNPVEFLGSMATTLFCFAIVKIDGKKRKEPSLLKWSKNIKSFNLEELDLLRKKFFEINNFKCLTEQIQ